MVISIPQNIFFQYLSWHFFDVPKKILKAFKNILLFNLEYFSIFLLLKTFFSHWRRYSFAYPRGFDIKVYAGVFFSNLISRVLGAVVRTFLIVLGILVEILILLLGGIVFLGWFFFPFILVLLLYFGLKFI